MEFNYEEEESSDDKERERGGDQDRERDPRPTQRQTAKHIAAGEERPRINSSQQTTPTDGKCKQVNYVGWLKMRFTRCIKYSYFYLILLIVFTTIICRGL